TDCVVPRVTVTPAAARRRLRSQITVELVGERLRMTGCGESSIITARNATPYFNADVCASVASTDKRLADQIALTPKSSAVPPGRTNPSRSILASSAETDF